MIVSHLLAAAACLTLANAQTFLSTVPIIDGDTVVYSISSDPVGGTVPVVIATLTDAAATSSSIAAPGVTSSSLATNTALTNTAVTSTGLTTSTGAAATNTVATTTPRVVGQPGPTTGEAGPTTYRYTTTDANGNTVVLTDTFTPSYGVTTVSRTVSAGSIIPYEQYTSMYGGGSSNQLNGAGAVRQLAAFGAGASAVICVIGGMALLL